MLQDKNNTFETNENESYSEIYCWGNNSLGQLGIGENFIEKQFNAPRINSFNFIVRSISCGEDHSSFITYDGSLYTFGSNICGKLGLGLKNRDIKYSSTPIIIDKLKGSKVISTSCGWNHTLAVLDNGEAYAWGSGEFGALGTGVFQDEYSPAKVFFKDDHNISIQKCSAGSRHSAFIDSNKIAYLTGSNDSGQLGIGQQKEKNFSFPQQLKSFNQKVKDVACGIAHSLILTVQGQVFATGSNKFGQLGQGDKKNSFFPIPVKTIEREQVIQIACGHHSGALSERGCLFIWGTGAFGEYLLPFNFFQTKNKIKHFDIGGLYGIAVDDNNFIWSWGSNSHGELGVSDFDARSTPFPIVSLQGAGIRSISCGSSHAIAIGKDVHFNFNNGEKEALNYSLTQSNQQLRNSISEHVSPQSKFRTRGGSISALHKSYNQDISPFGKSQANNLGKLVDIQLADPSIDVVMTENKYMESTLKMERDERVKLENANSELKLKLKELIDGQGGVNEVKDKLLLQSNENELMRNQLEEYLLKNRQIENQLKQEIIDHKLLQEKLKDKEQQYMNLEFKMRDIQETYNKKCKECDSLQYSLIESKESFRMKDKNNYEDFEQLKKTLLELEKQVERERELRKKSENIKNNERKAVNILEQEKSIIEAQTAELDRKYCSAILAVENECMQRKKVEEALTLQSQRVQNLEEQNKDLMQQLSKLRTAVYSNIEQKQDMNFSTNEIETLIQVNKELQCENKIILSKLEQKSQEEIELKRRINELLQQLQEFEHINYRQSSLVQNNNLYDDNYQHLKKSNIQNQQQQLSQTNIRNTPFNNTNTNFNQVNTNPESPTAQAITELLESAHKHAKHMTKIIKDLHSEESQSKSFEEKTPSPKRFYESPTFKQDNLNNNNVQGLLFNNSKERNIGGNSDWKLREALELPVSDKGKSGLRLKPDGGNLRNQYNSPGQQSSQTKKLDQHYIQKINNRQMPDQKDQNENEYLSSLGDIKAKLAKLQRDKSNLEQKMSKFERSVKKNK